jgi:hypothetical protein
MSLDRIVAQILGNNVRAGYVVTRLMGSQVHLIFNAGKEAQANFRAAVQDADTDYDAVIALRAEIASETPRQKVSIDVQQDAHPEN